MKLKNNKNIFWSLVVVFLFTGLMVFGLRQNPGFTPSVLVGKPVPTFLTGVYPLGQFNSKTFTNNKHWTVVNFWSSTCYVCRQEAFELQNFYQNVSLTGDEAVQLVSINIQENIETIRDWQRQYKQTFPVLLDKDGHISILFGVTGTPETFLVDPKGTVRYRISGEVDTYSLLNFIKWFENHPSASEQEARKQFVNSI